MDSGKAVVLTFLDLSVAFNTIDHDILCNCLRDWFGVDGIVLWWIKSYLSNHKQKVKLGNTFLDGFSLPYGVSQGSVLSPLLFTLYTTPLSNIISSFSVTHHPYADDTPKMPFAELFSDLIELAMSLSFFKNYTGSLLHTTSCLNTI